MIQQALYLISGKAKCFAAVARALMLLFILNPIQAATLDSPLQTDSHLTPIKLTQADTRYALASLMHSAGFIAAPDDLTLDAVMSNTTLNTLPALIAPSQSAGLTPDFTRHQRYWLFTQVVNHTNNTDWALHISNFGFEQVKVLIKGDDEQYLHTFQNSKYAGATDINTIGRAIKLTLQPGKSYLLVIELKATHVVWPPYIALMNEHQYQVWKVQMDYAFKLAVGVVIGLTLLAFICWLLTAEKVFFLAGLSSLLMLCYYLEHSSVPAIFWQHSYEKTFSFWVLFSATLLSLLAFSASFLQINKHSGRWYQVFTGTTLLTVVILVAGTLLSFKSKSFLYALNYVLVWGVILSSGVAKVRSDGRYYIIYILGWLPMVLSILHVILTLIFPQKTDQSITVSYKSIQVYYVQIAHMLIHAVALILRVKTLREDKLQAEFLSHAKSRFIAQSSHDLRQPLNSMNIFLDYLQPHIHGKEGEKIFNQLKKTRHQMSESFDTMVDFNKLEAGAIKAGIQVVSITNVFFRIHHEYQALATAKNIQLSIHSCSLNVLSDPVLLERMLRNLISNAIKYTDSGKVLIGCRRRGDHVAIQVLDTGCGIEKQEQNKIFNIYQRSVNNTKKKNGSGIGLSIVKQISTLLCHPLNVESIYGKGSVFTLTLPRAIEPIVNQQRPMHLIEHKLVIALAFQDSTLSNTIAGHLKKWGCSTQTFSSVENACQYYESLSNVTLDMLFCDFSNLKKTVWPPQKKGKRGPDYIAVCACNVSAVLPEHWITLPVPISAPQLRALLNVSIRRHQSQLDDKK